MLIETSPVRKVVSKARSHMAVDWIDMNDGIRDEFVA